MESQRQGSIAGMPRMVKGPQHGVGASLTDSSDPGTGCRPHVTPGHQPPGQPIARWLRGAGRLIHPFPTLVNVAAVLAFATVARGVPRSSTALLLVGAMFAAQATIGITNDLADVELDSTTKPSKPLVSGHISVRGARWLAAGSSVAAVLCAVAFGGVSLLLVTAGTALGIWYNISLKRTRWSWAPYVLALPLAPIWVWAALGAFRPGLLWLYPLGAPLLLALHIANALADFDGDLAAGNAGLVQVLGRRRADMVLWCGATLPLVVVTSYAATSAHSSLSTWLGLGAAALAIGGGAALRRYLSGEQAIFRLRFAALAIATAALALSWLTLVD